MVDACTYKDTTTPLVVSRIIIVVVMLLHVCIRGGIGANLLLDRDYCIHSQIHHHVEEQVLLLSM